MTDKKITDVEAIGSGEWDMQVQWLAPEQLVPNNENPNEQDDATFNALVESIEQDGWTAPLQVVALGKVNDRDMYEIVAGEHRWRAAKVLQCKVPVIALPQADFNEDRRQWALVKDNLIAGKANPEKFTKMFDRLKEKYDAEVLKSLMGFTSQDAFQKIYRQTHAGLDPIMQKALEDAKEEIKTIDDLSRVLNRLFQDHGETLPSNMMTFSYGSREVLWVRADKPLWDIVKGMAKRVEEEKLDMAAVMHDALRDYRPPAAIPGAALSPEFTEVSA